MPLTWRCHRRPTATRSRSRRWRPRWRWKCWSRAPGEVGAGCVRARAVGRCSPQHGGGGCCALRPLFARKGWMPWPRPRAPASAHRRREHGAQAGEDAVEGRVGVALAACFAICRYGDVRSSLAASAACAACCHAGASKTRQLRALPAVGGRGERRVALCVAPRSRTTLARDGKRASSHVHARIGASVGAAGASRALAAWARATARRSASGRPRGASFANRGRCQCDTAALRDTARTSGSGVHRRARVGARPA